MPTAFQRHRARRWIHPAHSGQLKPLGVPDRGLRREVFEQRLTLTEKTVNRALAAARAPVERGVARLKSWRIFRRSRCSPNRMTSIAKAVLTLERQR